MAEPRDEFFMRMALKLARKGEGRVSPNPMVGAVIVRGGRVIGRGYHETFGGKHAEINAIENAAGNLEGATIYITLEPCAHVGKTPPCLHRLLDTGFSRVVIGSIDPNPRVSGRSLRALRRRGIDVTAGVLGKECRDLNEPFFKFMETGRPFVTLKFAQSIDGKIATATGHSRWISSERSRVYAHRLRSLHDAILVGSGTVAKDDPELTCRLVRGRDPLRVIVDSTLKIPLKARVLQEQDRARTIVFTGKGHDRKKMAALAGLGIEVKVAGSRQVDLTALLEELGRRQVSSLLVEGGARLLTSFIRERLADRLIIISAPKIFGKGTDAIGDLSVKTVDQAISLDVRRVSHRGEDIIVDARLPGVSAGKKTKGG